jgi:DNA-binding PadR family transcriptional regulator
METADSRPGKVLAVKTYLEGCLLLLIAESPNHGYDLMDRLGDMGLGPIDSGAVYRALRSLNRCGLVQSWWEASASGPTRRRYRISADGIASLGARAEVASHSARVLSDFAARHERLQTPNSFPAGPAADRFPGVAVG